MSSESNQVLVVLKIKAASVYKLLLLGLVASFIPLGVLFGIMAFFGADTVKWNKEPIHGVGALLAGPAISVFVALLFTAIVGTLTCIGLWLISRIRPISIRVVPCPAAVSQAQQGIKPDEPASGGSAG